MRVLVLGASGATGRKVVSQLVNRKISTRIVVRNRSSISKDILDNDIVQTVVGNIYEFDKGKNDEITKGCDAFVCCLGHNITLRGIFGKPHLLVTHSLKNVCESVSGTSTNKVKVILMNTTANEDKRMNEKRSAGERAVLSILTTLLPPQKDNVEAAKYLVSVIGENNRTIEWTAVRPDTLTDEDEESAYEVVDTITRSPLFDPGKTSRINVGHFMAALLTDEDLWNKWKSKMPVIYNKNDDEKNA